MAQGVKDTLDATLRKPRLVRVQPTGNNWVQKGSGGTVAFVEGLGWTIDQAAANPALLQLSLRTTFRGRYLAVRFKNIGNASVTQPTFSLRIDGEIVPVPRLTVRYMGETQIGGSPKREDEAVFLVPIDDLDDREHTIDVIVQADTVGPQRVLVYGFMLEERFGSSSDPKLTVRTAPATVTNAAVAIPATVGPTNFTRNLVWASRLELTNPAGTGARIVQVSDGTTTFNVSVAADDRVLVDLGGQIPVGLLTVKDTVATSTAKVVTIGGWY